jgi:hypothetical protein
MSTFLDTSLAQWLGSLESWEAGLTVFGGLVGTAITTVWPIVRAFRKQRQEAWEAADKPVAPTIKPPALPPVDPRFEALAKQVSAVTSWSLEDARDEIRRLQKENALLRWEHDEANQVIRDLERAVASADHRAQVAVTELTEYKRATTSGMVTRPSKITPLRPPAKREA